MVAFLIKRPIAVSMTLLGILILGMVAAGYLPVSLVPDVDIPRITVSINTPDYSARQLENSVMAPLRNRLMQANQLQDIRTESRDGGGLVNLEFQYGTNTDLAYIEINEHIDRAMQMLPGDIARPAVIKASASDIPVLYLNVCLINGNKNEISLTNDLSQINTNVDPQINTNVAPQINTNVAPQINTNDDSQISTNDDPQINTNVAPQINTNDLPLLNSNDLPLLNTNDLPLLNTNDLPLINTNDDSQISKIDHPQISTNKPGIYKNNSIKYQRNGKSYVLNSKNTDCFSDEPINTDRYKLSKTSNMPGQSFHDNAFQELSGFADEIIRRRLEQIPQVAMADMSGRTFPEVIIEPDMNKLRALDLPLSKIESVIISNNLNFGNIVIHDKQYRYSIRFGNRLLNADDIGELYVKHEGRLWQLKDLCHIETRQQPDEGMVYAGDRRTITVAVIKQADAKMQDLKKALHELIGHFETDYPELGFKIYRDQTALLDLTMRNLKQTIVTGAILAFLVMFVFLHDPRTPWLVILSVPAALIISMLCFYVIGISLNVVSLSGLVLCVGMMIDNAIIVTDNITRHYHNGKSLELACADGTNEVFRPLLSSVLTTCSVFIPLIFLGGLPGALFFDQAMAVTIGLMISLLIATTLLPVYFYALRKTRSHHKKTRRKQKATPVYIRWYAAGLRFALRRQASVWIIAVLLIAGMTIMFYAADKERLPAMQRKTALLWIDWNENIHVEENLRRTQLLVAETPEPVFSTLLAGRQQFIFDNANNSRQHSMLYLKASGPSALEEVIRHISDLLSNRYPMAIYRFHDDGNLFDHMFADHRAPLEIRLHPTGFCTGQLPKHLKKTIHLLKENLPDRSFRTLSIHQAEVLKADQKMLALHDVSMGSLQQKMTRLFQDKQVSRLMDHRSGIPVKIGAANVALEDIMHQETITNRKGAEIPLNTLLKRSARAELQSIVAGLNGEYYALETVADARELNLLEATIRGLLAKEGLFEASFAGSIYKRMELVRELVLIGLVAIMLLFFILAAQFESLRLPFIILLEVPLAMSGALFLLMVTGETLNLMSMTGMVVMTGIIINDSILKIDTINRLTVSGTPLVLALVKAGHYRLKPILMTSITTICALLPFLFIGGLGGDLQRPLAVSVIGGLGLGTLVSLFFIPVCYYCLSNGKKWLRG